MTRRPGDPGLDDELRDVLRERDPGAAPFELRTRVLDVPERTEPAERPGARPPVAALLGLAAVILLAVVGLATIRNLGQPGVSGTTGPGTPASSPSPAASPASAFNPNLEGPGISATDDMSPAIVVVPACILLGALAITIRGWRRVLSAGGALVLAAWAVLGMLVPVTVGVNSFGSGLNTFWATSLPGSDEKLMYEVAPPDGRFSHSLGFFQDGPLPIRIEGIVEPLFGRDPRSFGPSIMRTAVWIDGEPNGGMTGPNRPFAPFDLLPNGKAIWIIGKASACALGSAFDTANPDTVGGYGTMDSLDLRVSVLGWPRTIHLPLPFRLVEPEQQSCLGTSPQPSGSGGAQ